VSVPILNKRYFKKSDVKEMFERYNFIIKSYYTGDAFIAAIVENY
jgi:hypothetical protein